MTRFAKGASKTRDWGLSFFKECCFRVRVRVRVRVDTNPNSNPNPKPKPNPNPK